MPTLVHKRSIIIAGHKTSVSPENAFWSGLRDIVHHKDMTLSNMIAEIDTGRDQKGNLSSAIRLFVLAGHHAPPLKRTYCQRGPPKLAGRHVARQCPETFRLSRQLLKVKKRLKKADDSRNQQS
jgi:predicted DNA-binding ribbon-helix-helix protein